MVNLKKADGQTDKHSFMFSVKIHYFQEKYKNETVSNKTISSTTVSNETVSDGILIGPNNIQNSSHLQAFNKNLKFFKICI